MKKLSLLVVMLLTMAMVAACGSTGGSDSEETSAAATAATDSGSSEIGDPESTDITLYAVNDLQISAAVMVAETQGYFEDEGLNVEVVYMANVPEIAAVMANGEAKIACANNYSTPSWVSNGVGCSIVAPTCNMGGTQCLLLREGIEIESAEDLEGLSIGMVSGSTQYVCFLNMCEALGLDADSFEIVTLQFADQLSALSQGQIDIMAVPEPWVTKAQEECNATLLCSGTYSYIPGAESEVTWCNLYATLNVNDEWAAENTNTIAHVMMALDKATDFINNSRDEAVTICAEYIGMSEEDTAKIMDENVYMFGVDDTYVDTFIELEEFMIENDILTSDSGVTFADYHDFSILRSILSDSYTAAEEY